MSGANDGAGAEAEGPSITTPVNCKAVQYFETLHKSLQDSYLWLCSRKNSRQYDQHQCSIPTKSGDKNRRGKLLRFCLSMKVLKPPSGH
ncbi:hypothetical protein GUJ93_ZPchr0001g32201 [Zizania palustris]|uniref:Uncharacterized protein n=1 Tax=Zizania palustris TaxID=103762 RepID=A0A8J5VNH9_ZIZPA|nr:hypothetical protein GUJ93_ZPchr0001g32201 [Zizania palustris]